MMYEIIITTIVLISFSGMVLTGFGRMLPIAIKAFPFIALIIFWLNSLLFRLQGQGGTLSVILVIVFYLLFIVIILPLGLGSYFFSTLDREQKIGPIITGNPQGNKLIYLIFHPGGSKLPTNTVQTFGKMLDQSDIRVEIYSAHHELQLNLKNAVAVGFSSPLYAGKIRPPVLDYINSVNFEGYKTFLILTSGGKTPHDKDVEKTSEILSGKGAEFIGGVKVAAMEESPIEEQLQPLIDQIDDNL